MYTFCSLVIQSKTSLKGLKLAAVWGCKGVYKSLKTPKINFLCWVWIYTFFGIKSLKNMINIIYLTFWCSSSNVIKFHYRVFSTLLPEYTIDDLGSTLMNILPWETRTERKEEEDLFIGLSLHSYPCHGLNELRWAGMRNEENETPRSSEDSTILVEYKARHEAPWLIGTNFHPKARHIHKYTYIYIYIYKTSSNYTLYLFKEGYLNLLKFGHKQLFLKKDTELQFTIK